MTPVMMLVMTPSDVAAISNGRAAVPVSASDAAPTITGAMPPATIWNMAITANSRARSGGGVMFCSTVGKTIEIRVSTVTWTPQKQ